VTEAPELKTSENSPPRLVKEAVVPDPSGVVSSVVGASVTFTIAMEDLNNPEQLEVWWYIDYFGPDVGTETAPCTDGGIAATDQFDLAQGTVSTVRTATKTFAFADPGCHKVEAIGCDGPHAGGSNACFARGCAPGSFEVRQTWFVCAFVDVPDCSTVECQ